jgi:hypothetical protein
MGWFDKAQYWMGRGMIKLDPTPGNVVVTKALPWYHRNIEQPWASTFARPVRLMFDPKMLAEENKYSSWEQAQRALNPWSAQRRKEYESWKSPWGVKGALEMSTPTNLIPMAAGPSVVAKGATVAAKGATKMGATRAAAGLTKTANVAAKTAKVVSTVENLPGKAIGKGVGMAGQGVRKAIRPPKPITRTATGIITTPEGMEFKGAMKGMETGEYARPDADNWTKKPWQKPEGKQPWDDLTGQDRYSVQSEAVDNIPDATIDDGLEHSREWWRAKKLEAAGIEPNSQLWKQEINLTGYRLKRGETWRDLVMRKVERMEEIHGPKEIEGWHTPVNEGKSALADVQGSGLPRGKFIALDKPFESDIHDVARATRTKVNVKNVYDPDGVMGAATPSLSDEFVALANKTLKANPKADARQIYTDFLKSKGYDSYVRGIDGDPLNRELIVFGEGVSKSQPPLQRVSSIQRVGRPQPLEFRGAIKGMETGGMQAPKEPWQMTKRYHGTGKPIDQPPLQRVSSIQRVGRPQPLEFRGAMKGMETGGMQTPITKAKFANAAEDLKPHTGGKWYHGGAPGHEDDLIGGMVTRNYDEAARYAKEIKGGVVYEVPDEAVEVATTASRGANGETFWKPENYGYIRPVEAGGRGWQGRVAGVTDSTNIPHTVNTIPEASTIEKAEAPYRVGTIEKGGKPPVQPPTATTTMGGMAEFPKQGPINPTATGAELDETVLNLLKDTPVLLKEQAKLRSQELSKRVGAAEAAGVGKTGIERVKATKSALKGEMPKMEFKPIGDMLTDAQRGELYDRAATAYSGNTFKKVQTWDALTKILDDGALPTGSEYKLLQEVYGEDFVQMLYKKAEEVAAKNRTLLGKVGYVASETTGAMRTLQTMGDMSAVLRQGLIGMAAHPIQGSKSFVKAIKSLGNEELANQAVRQFEEHELAPIMKMAQKKPDILTAGTGMLTKSEEMFTGNVIDKVWGLKTVKELSERHFTTTLNIMRHDIYYKMLGEWQKMYPDLADDILKTGRLGDTAYKDAAATTRTAAALKQLDDLGEFTNIITGRGDLGPLEKHATTLNTLLYASKLMASRLEYIPKGIVYGVRNPVIRKEFARELAALTGVTLGILGAAKAAGASVEMDARSTDFGKIRVGDTRIDLMGGFQPYIRYTAQIITGQRKSSSGRIYNVSRADTFGRFLRSKESPVAGLVHDVMTGSSFIGQDVDLSSATAGRIAYEKFTPLFIQDVYDAVKQEGATGAVMAAPGFVGATVSSYGPEGHTVKEYRDKVAQKAYGMSWEDVGRLKGKYYQTLLEETDAKLNKIVEKQRQEKLKAAGIPKTAWDRWYGAQQQITEDVDEAIAKADEAVKSGRMTPAQFRERVDDILSQARQARNWMETDPQYKTVTDYLATPSGKDMAIGDVAYNDYVSSVYDSSLTDSLGRYDYAEAESRKRAILQKYGADVYQYVQQRLTAGQKDEPSTMTMLRQARETLKPYWGIEDKYWQAYPQLKEINEQIKMLEATNPDKAKLALRRYPRIVLIRKRIAQEKQMLRKRNPEINQALIFYR